MVGPRIVLVLFIATMFAGCADVGTSDTQAKDSKSVGNVRDSFGYSMSAANKTKVETYKWENTASKANIGLSASGTRGDFTLTIKDAAGLTVHQDSFSGKTSQSLATDRGLAGSWTIELGFDDYYGAISLGITANHGG